MSRKSNKLLAMISRDLTGDYTLCLLVHYSLFVSGFWTSFQSGKWNFWRLHDIVALCSMDQGTRNYRKGDSTNTLSLSAKRDERQTHPDTRVTQIFRFIRTSQMTQFLDFFKKKRHIKWIYRKKASCPALRQFVVYDYSTDYILTAYVKVAEITIFLTYGLFYLQRCFVT
jgi:hypothetical protein